MGPPRPRAGGDGPCVQRRPLHLGHPTPALLHCRPQAGQHLPHLLSQHCQPCLTLDASTCWMLPLGTAATVASPLAATTLCLTSAGGPGHAVPEVHLPAEPCPWAWQPVGPWQRDEDTDSPSAQGRGWKKRMGIPREGLPAAGSLGCRPSRQVRLDGLSWRLPSGSTATQGRWCWCYQGPAHWKR